MIFSYKIIATLVFTTSSSTMTQSFGEVTHRAEIGTKARKNMTQKLSISVYIAEHCIKTNPLRICWKEEEV